MITVFAFVFVVSLLVLVHELGHFTLARIFGVRVLHFALGYGPKLASWMWGKVEFSVRLFPLGGYVRMAGMEGNFLEGRGEQLVPPSERFDVKPFWQRSLIVLAGPCMNLVLSVVLLFLVFSLVGIPTGRIAILDVLPGGPAERSGVRKGDVLLAVDGKRVEHVEDVTRVIASSPGRPVVLTLEREGEILEIVVIPEWNDVEKRALIRVVFGGESKKYNPLVTLAKSGITVVGWFVFSFLGVLYAFVGRVPFEVTGPLGIAQMAGQAASFGFVNLLAFAAVVSVFLALFNLFPVPVLDGGHLILFLYEKIRGRALEEEKKGVIYLIGIVFIFLLSVFVTYQDVLRIVMRK
ncbi:MAG: M50 family metallopeptidase [Candidatus Caldatribacterium sp.]|nr:M50 family metallopeptidase [Candidatus Caldatribacterium sp.]